MIKAKFTGVLQQRSTQTFKPGALDRFRSVISGNMMSTTVRARELADVESKREILKAIHRILIEVENKEAQFGILAKVEDIDEWARIMKHPTLWPEEMVRNQYDKMEATYKGILLTEPIDPIEKISFNAMQKIKSLFN